MTKSTDKKTGPIRWQAVIPFFIFSGAVAAYSYLFLDSHLKSALELIGTYTYGAEVNIDELESSVPNASLEIYGIQITEIDHPERNILEFDEIRVQLLWDALLRAKFVISDASILGVQTHTPRNKPGRVVRTKKENSQATNAIQKQLLGNASEQLQGNVLGDAAALLDGQDPTKQLKIIESDLQTKKQVDELQKSLKEKEQSWKQRLASLPQSKDFDAIKSQLKSLKFDSKKPLEFAKSVEEASKILKETERKVRHVKKSGGELKGDLKQFKTGIGSLESFIQKDIKDLQNRIKLPELDTKQMASLLFGKDILEYFRKGEEYYALVKDYLPEKDKKGASGESAPTSLTPKERALGKNYQFGTPTSYPQFWLQKATLSSDTEQAKLSGSLRDLSSDPKHLRRPTTITIKGDIPPSELKGLDATIELDATKEVPEQRFVATVQSFPVKGKMFSESKDVRFGFRQASARAKVTGLIKEGQLFANISNQFRKIQYITEAKSKIMQEVLIGVAKDVPVVTMDARIKGSLREPAINLRSNLAKALQDSLGKQLKQQIAQAKAKVRNMIESKVGAEKAKLLGEFNKVQNKYLGEVSKLQNKAQGAQNQLKEEIDKKKSAKNQQLKKVEDKAKKELKKLFKGLKF